MLQVLRPDEQALAQIVVHGRLTLALREAAEPDEIVAFDACETVFSLRVQGAEDRIGVGLAVHMGDSPVVAHDFDVPGFAQPARPFTGAGLDADRGAHQTQREEREAIHSLRISIRARRATSRVAAPPESRCRRKRRPKDRLT